MVAVTLPAVRRSWEEAVHTALASIFGFLAAEPAFARMQAVEAYAAGPAAVKARERTVAPYMDAQRAYDVARG